jgi:hypothetical protein
VLESIDRDLEHLPPFSLGQANGFAFAACTG